jgi:hypothetical protein
VSDRRTPDATLISALRILARDIQSGDGVANACLLEAATRLEELVEERRWVPVKERLPELNEENYFRVDCLVYCKSGGVCEMTYEINTYAKQERNRQPRWKRHGMISMWEVTHWKLLPPGPEGEEEVK